MKIGVIIAMDIEYRQMFDAIGGERGKVGENEVVLWQCGIGKVNAAIGTMRLVQEEHPDMIISTGLAGGIDERMRVMDIMVAEQAVYHDVWCGMGNERGQVQGLPVRFDADRKLVEATERVERGEGERLVRGLICTGDQFITDAKELSIIKGNFPDGMACDMESAAIAHTCFLLKVPFLSLRVISDTPGNTENHQQQWEDFLSTMCDRSFRFVRRYLELI